MALYRTLRMLSMAEATTSYPRPAAITILGNSGWNITSAAQHTSVASDGTSTSSALGAPATTDGAAFHSFMFPRQSPTHSTYRHFVKGCALQLTASALRCCPLLVSC